VSRFEKFLREELGGEEGQIRRMKRAEERKAAPGAKNETTKGSITAARFPFGKPSTVSVKQLRHYSNKRRKSR